MSQDTPTNKPTGHPQRQMFDQDGAGGAGRQHSTGGRPHGAGQVYRADSSGRPAHSGQPQRTASARPRVAGQSAGGGSTGRRPPGAPVHRSERSKARLRRKRRRRIVAGTIAITLVVGIVLGLYLLYQNIAKELRGEDTVDGSIPEAVKTVNIPEYTGKSLICGLVCGIDYDLDEDGQVVADQIGRTDMIMYVMFNTATGKVNILQIPRDVYVGDEASTGGTHKINSLYFSAEDPNERMAPLLQVVNDQLGLPVDFYITIDMDAVKEIIAIRGSLDVYVPRDVVDKDNPNNMIEEGWRGIGPEEAEFLLRNRNYGDADITRLQVQQNFYSALYREFVTLAPKDLMMWMAVLLYRVNVGGIGPVQIGGLAQKALKVKGEDITFVRPPVLGVRYQGQDMVSLVADETADLLNQYFRPEGSVKTVEDLDIRELTEYDIYGKVEARVVTMAGIQSEEAPAAA